MTVMISTSGSPSQGASLGLSEIVNRVITSSSAFNTPDVNDNVTQALEFLLTGQPIQKQLSDELIKAVRDAIVQAPFVYQYTYNIEDQLLSLNDPITTTNYSYTYDVNGNLISKADYYGNYSFTWDELSRLTKIIRTPISSASALTVSYSYDSKDRRTQSVIATSEAAKQAITTHSYSYSENTLMEETVAKTTTINGQPTAENHTVKYTPGSAITLDSTTYYYVINGHGDVKEITDTNGDTVVKYYYDAWGNLTSVTASASAAVSLDTAKKLAELNPYTYANYHYEGSDTGMYYLKARYYDPAIGRFISKDPVKFENLYIYCKNNPVNMDDKSGKATVRIRAAGDGEWREVYYYPKYDWKNEMRRRLNGAMKFYKEQYWEHNGKKDYFNIKYVYAASSIWHSDDEAETIGDLKDDLKKDITTDNVDIVYGFTGQTSVSGGLGVADGIYDGETIYRYALTMYQGSNLQVTKKITRHEIGHLYGLYHNDYNPGKDPDYNHGQNHRCFMKAYGDYSKLCHVRHRKQIYENRKIF